MSLLIVSHLKKVYTSRFGGQTVLMVTHSVKAASCADRVLFIKDGYGCRIACMAEARRDFYMLYGSLFLLELF